MHVIAFSLTHQTAPIGAREAAIAALGDVPRWLSAVGGDAAVAEAIVVSTCHRLEFYVVAQDEAAARRHVAASCGLTRGELDGDGVDGWRVRRDTAAAVHLARVTAGLDSLIVGEAEIAGQVRRAATLARETGALGRRLEKIVAGALRASGRARSETRISEGVTSAASAAVALATATLGTLDGRHVLVIGAGQAAQTALGRLRRRSIGRVSVASRSRKHAEEAAAPLEAAVLALQDVPGALADADVVIAATFAGGFVIDAATCTAAFAAAPGRARVFVDLSVPRVIDPAVAGIAGVTLVSVDDLGDVVAESTRRRLREVPRAEAIAAEEGARAFSASPARRARS